MSSLVCARLVTCAITLALVTACGSDPEPGPDNRIGGFVKVAHHGDRFVAVGLNESKQGTIAWSDDGLTFTHADVPDVPALVDVAASPNGWVAIGRAPEDQFASAVVLISTDGTSWKHATSGPLVKELLAIRYGNGMFVAIGEKPSVDTQIAYVSGDGDQWHRTGFDIGAIWSSPGLAFDGELFFIYGASSQLAASPDGQSWTFLESGLTWIKSLQPRRDGGLVGTAHYDCCFGEEPEAIQQYLLSYDVTTDWQVIETDRALEAVRVEGSTVLGVEKEIVRAEGPIGAGPWTVVADHVGRSIASDGAGTWVVAGATAGLGVSTDDGVTWSIADEVPAP